VSLIVASLQDVPADGLSNELTEQKEKLTSLCNNVMSPDESVKEEGTALFLALYPTIIDFLESFKE
jgi:hypothetical protein